MQMVAAELADFYGKQPNQIDADTLVPYLVYVVLLGIYEVAGLNEDGDPHSVASYMCKAFKVRLIMIEHFTV